MTPQKNNSSSESDTGRRFRRSAELSEGLRERLAAYATVAGAACVGVVALAQPAQADIILNTNPISIAENTSVPFQINGVTQFTFVNFLQGSLVSGEGALSINSGLGHVLASGFSALRLAKGDAIGPGGPFAARSALIEFGHWGRSFSFGTPRTYRIFNGNWYNTSGYLGFEFLSNGQTHFGWAQAHVSLYPPSPTLAVINEFAYDTVPNQSIEAGQTSSTPEPGTLGLLALGSLGLGFWRRRKAGTTV